MKTCFTLFICLTTSILFAQLSDFNSIDFTRADNIAKLNEGASLNNLPILSYNLTHKLSTDVEKFRAIFFWICNNIKANDNLNTKILNKREKLKNDSIAYIYWDRQNRKIFLKKLIKNKSTVCTGYAYLIKELCFFANIECEIINGYGRTIDNNAESLELINHSWNAIKLNNKWYLCDATWASGYIDEKGNFIKEFNEGYFLTEPTLFNKNHIPENQIKEINEIFPLVYSETFKLKIDPILPSTLKLNCKIGEEITFSYKSLNNEYIPSLIQLKGVKEIPFKIFDVQKKNQTTSFKYSFSNKGNYDVHLKANDDIVATYIINVE